MNYKSTLDEVANKFKSIPQRVHQITEGQNRYCQKQQKNERTYNVLKAKLGEDRAKQFMTSILFPKID